MSKVMTVCGAMLLVAGAVGAQERTGVRVMRQAGGDGTPVVIDQTRVQGEMRMKVPLEAKSVPGAPYSAEVVTENVQVLPDGNRIVNQNRSRVFRDGQGRVRREEERDGQLVSVSITDPVNKTSFSLDPAARVAWKTPFGVARIVMYSPAASGGADPAQVERRRKVEQEMQQVVVKIERSQREVEAAERAGNLVTVKPSLQPMREKKPAWEEKVEELAPRQIEGIPATGTRTTRTIPAGAIGNERAIEIVSEEWRSPELQVLLLTTTSDPRVGESVYKLTNISRAEPSPALFEVPSDYTVKDTGVRRMPSGR